MIFFGLVFFLVKKKKKRLFYFGVKTQNNSSALVSLNLRLEAGLPRTPNLVPAVMQWRAGALPWTTRPLC